MTKRSHRPSTRTSWAAVGVHGAVIAAAGIVACATLPVVPIDKPEDAAVPEASADVQVDSSLEAAVDADGDAGADAGDASDASLDAGADAEDEDADAG